MIRAETKPDGVTGSGVALIVEASAEGALPALLECDLANRFELRGEVARGGMGRIVEGWDARHDRKVAIKLLLHGEGESALRFAREARLTARLQHPGIIPVYESGRSMAGEPFYVMRFVEGGLLAHVVAQRPSFQERLSLLPHMVAATDALAYAHARGIIHRDLKPANLLIGPFGETVVIDWGLAKETKETGKGETPWSESSTGGLASLTIHGRAIGTPRFMPPEQARGEAADERSDVYALGALLYFVLSGVAPYDGTTSDEVLSKAKAGPPPALAQLEPRVPTDLAAIVTKAMAREPGERYAAAHEMAADLKRFAAGQLVSVHTYSPTALLRRWASRHAAALAVGGVLLVTLAVVGALSVRRIVHERDRADATGRASLTQRDAAEQLVAFVISDLRDRLRAVGRLDVLAGVGKEVDAYYETVAPLGEGRDLGIIERRAAALETLADVEEAEHALDAARALYDAAEKLRAEATARGNTAESRLALARLLTKRASFALRNEKDSSSALEPAGRAAAIGDAVVAASGGNVDGLAVAAGAHAAVARVHMSGRRYDVARPEVTLAVSLARRRVDAQPSSPEALRLLGEMLSLAADLDEKQGRFDLRAADEAIAILERVLAAAAENAEDLLALSKAYDMRARARVDANDVARALDDATRMMDLRARLAGRDPANVEWQRLLGQAYDILSDMQQLAKRSDDAVASSRKSVQILSAIAARNPDAPAIHDDLLLAYQRLGWILEREGHLAEAAEALSTSLVIAERFAGTADGRRFKGRLADGHGLLADVLFQASGKRDEARAHMRAAVAILETFGDEEGLQAQRFLILGRLTLAESEPRGSDEARHLRTTALELFVRKNLDNNEEAALLQLSRACLALLPTEDAGAREMVRKAISMLEPLRVAGDDPKPRLALLAEARRRLGP